jgi:putative redox protein
LRKIDDKQKNILKNSAETCPVMQSINPNIEVKIDWGEWSAVY